MKITLRPAFISFLVMVLLFSCKEKLNELAPVTQSTPITVAEAQQYYNTRSSAVRRKRLWESTPITVAEAQQYYNTLQQKLKLQEAAGKPTKRTQKKVRKADWQQAKTLKRNKLEWVELPVIFDEDLNNRGLTARKMFFFKDKKNKIYTYIYEWVMDSDFYKKNNVLANNYSGALMIYDEEGNLLGGNMYKNGKFISNVVLMIDSEMIMPVKDKAKAGRTTFALPEGYDVFMYDAYSYSGNVSTTQYYPSLNELNSVIEACGNVNVIMMHSRPGIKVDEYYPLPWVLPFVAGGESGDNGGSHHSVTTETSANDETLVWVPAPTTVDLAESFISLYSNYFTCLLYTSPSPRD